MLKLLERTYQGVLFRIVAFTITKYPELLTGANILAKPNQRIKLTSNGIENLGGNPNLSFNFLLLKETRLENIFSLTCLQCMLYYMQW